MNKNAQPAPEKKTYSTPKLVVYGDIRSITANGTGGGVGDATNKNSRSV